MSVFVVQVVSCVLISVWTYMVSSRCIYRSSPPPPSTSWSSFRMISFSNCRRGKKKKKGAIGDERNEWSGNIREDVSYKHRYHILSLFYVSRQCHRKPNNCTLNTCTQSSSLLMYWHISVWKRYLVKVPRVCMFTSDHVKEDGDGGSSQFLFRDQCHLQDGTHYARYETDLVAA